MTFLKKLRSIYFNSPVFYDFIICAVICIGIHLKQAFLICHFNNDIIGDVISNLISGQISLTGFILAALTIIVTFKSNITSKGLEESTNALELLFSTKHYKKIVRVFKTAIIELTASFIIMYILWPFVTKSSLEYTIMVVFLGFVTITLPLIRCLIVLFSIMDLENKTKE